jgi:hypothetical protein
VEGYLQKKIAKSEKGVYFLALEASCHKDKRWLRVWILNKSSGQMVWVLKHDIDFKHKPCQWFCRRAKWILEDINYHMFRASGYPEDGNRETSADKFEWNSDEDVEDTDIVDHGYLETGKI